MNLTSILQIAISSAYEGGAILHKHFGAIDRIEKKGKNDLVTIADKSSEKAIIEKIRSKYPTHGILAEESGIKDGIEDIQWIIDPLDGTTNYAHGLPIFSVSIAVSIQKEIVVGAVLNPMTSELFTAMRGCGASLNGKKIGVSKSSTLSESLLVTGFPYKLEDILNPSIKRFKDLLSISRGVRRLGSAALDLCFVASGRFDGFWESRLKPWDTAAGVLIASEAGAKITDFEGRRYTTEKDEIVATNELIHSEMLSILR